MSTTDGESPSRRRVTESHPTADGPLPEVVDWVVGGLIAFGGLVSLVGGSALLFAVDRAVLAEGIESGTVTVNVLTLELTGVQQTEVATAVVTWVGIGLLVTGIGMVLVAAGFVLSRHRAHRRVRDGETVRSFWSYALLGAVGTAALSFLPFSPVLGGALAGYLERAESDRTAGVGALAGLFSTVPVLTTVLAAFVGLVVGLFGIGESGLAAVLVAITLLSVLTVAAIGAGLGALGGYLGGRFAETNSSGG